MIDHSQMKLGRKAVKRDTRTLRLARYLTPSLPAAPVARDWTMGIQQWGAMLNDRLGDCTIAGCAHAVQVWSANLGREITVPDAVVLGAYEAWDGYEPNDPSTDQGGVELDVLTRWRAEGFGGHKLLGFAGVRAADVDEARTAIHLFGGCYIGLALPLTAQRQPVWDVATLEGDGDPGSWGGHCVYVAAYDPQGFTCITWGQLKRMTVSFWESYCDEAYALLGADWLGAQGSPGGFDLAALKADLAQLH